MNFGFEYKGQRVFFSSKEAVYASLPAQALLQRAAAEGGVLTDLCSQGRSPIFLIPVINPHRSDAHCRVYGFRVASFTLAHSDPSCPCLAGNDPDLVSETAFALTEKRTLSFEEPVANSENEPSERLGGFTGLANASFSRAYTDVFLEENRGQTILTAKECATWPKVAVKFGQRLHQSCTAGGHTPTQIAAKSGLELVFGLVDSNLFESMKENCVSERQVLVTSLSPFGWSATRIACSRFLLSKSQLVEVAGRFSVSNSFIQPPFFFFGSCVAHGQDRYLFRHLFVWPVLVAPDYFFGYESAFEGRSLRRDADRRVGAILKAHRLRELNEVLAKMHPIAISEPPIQLPFRPDAVISSGTEIKILEYLGRKDEAYLNRKANIERWVKQNRFPYPLVFETYDLGDV